MIPIGGYFSLELMNRGGFIHDDGVLLNTGRNALEYILRTLEDVRLLYVPYYICEVVLEPIHKLEIPYCFYHINACLEIAENIELGYGEYLLYTNYFGIKDEYCKTLTKQYGKQLIVDNAQAWFAEPTDCAGTTYSPRKFVGVPDGGIAYCDNRVDVMERDESHSRSSHLLKRIDLGATEGYEDFHANEDSLIGQPIRRMSHLTNALMSSIDHDDVRVRRWQNFKQLHEFLGASNDLIMPDFSTFACPMVYPYMTVKPRLKKFLIANNIFVATYWPNIFNWCSAATMECQIVDECIPIPMDQRYGYDEMEAIIQYIKENYE